jgi:hypothetical protein
MGKNLRNAFGGEPPALAGELDFSPAEKLLNFAMGFSPGASMPGAKALDLKTCVCPGALKRSFPRMNAGAPPKVPTQLTPLQLSLVQSEARPAPFHLISEVAGQPDCQGCRIAQRQQS